MWRALVIVTLLCGNLALGVEKLKTDEVARPDPIKRTVSVKESVSEVVSEDGTRLEPNPAEFVADEPPPGSIPTTKFVVVESPDPSKFVDRDPESNPVEEKADESEPSPTDFGQDEPEESNPGEPDGSVNKMGLLSAIKIVKGTKGEMRSKNEDDMEEGGSLMNVYIQVAPDQGGVKKVLNAEFQDDEELYEAAVASEIPPSAQRGAHIPTSQPLGYLGPATDVVKEYIPLPAIPNKSLSTADIHFQGVQALALKQQQEVAQIEKQNFQLQETPYEENSYKHALELDAERVKAFQQQQAAALQAEHLRRHQEQLALARGEEDTQNQQKEQQPSQVYANSQHNHAKYQQEGHQQETYYGEQHEAPRQSYPEEYPQQRQPEQQVKSHSGEYFGQQQQPQTHMQSDDYAQRQPGQQTQTQPFQFSQTQNVQQQSPSVQLLPPAQAGDYTERSVEQLQQMQPPTRQQYYENPYQEQPQQQQSAVPQEQYYVNQQQTTLQPIEQIRNQPGLYPQVQTAEHIQRQQQLEQETLKQESIKQQALQEQAERQDAFQRNTISDKDYEEAESDPKSQIREPLHTQYPSKHTFHEQAFLAQKALQDEVRMQQQVIHEEQIRKLQNMQQEAFKKQQDIWQNALQQQKAFYEQRTKQLEEDARKEQEQQDQRKAAEQQAIAQQQAMREQQTRQQEAISRQHEQHMQGLNAQRIFEQVPGIPQQGPVIHQQPIPTQGYIPQPIPLGPIIFQQQPYQQQLFQQQPVPTQAIYQQGAPPQQVYQTPLPPRQPLYQQAIVPQVQPFQGTQPLYQPPLAYPHVVPSPTAEFQSLEFDQNRQQQPTPQFGDSSQGHNFPANPSQQPQPNSGYQPQQQQPQPNTGYQPQQQPQPSTGYQPQQQQSQPNTGHQPQQQQPQPNTGHQSQQQQPQPNTGHQQQQPHPNSVYEPQQNFGHQSQQQQQSPNSGFPSQRQPTPNSLYQSQRQQPEPQQQSQQNSGYPTPKSQPNAGPSQETPKGFQPVKETPLYTIYKVNDNNSPSSAYKSLTADIPPKPNSLYSVQNPTKNQFPLLKNQPKADSRSVQSHPNQQQLTPSASISSPHFASALKSGLGRPPSLPNVGSPSIQFFSPSPNPFLGSGPGVTFFPPSPTPFLGAPASSPTTNLGPIGHQVQVPTPPRGMPRPVPLPRVRNEGVQYHYPSGSAFPTNEMDFIAHQAKVLGGPAFMELDPPPTQVPVRQPPAQTVTTKFRAQIPQPPPRPSAPQPTRQNQISFNSPTPPLAHTAQSRSQSQLPPVDKSTRHHVADPQFGELEVKEIGVGKKSTIPRNVLANLLRVTTGDELIEFD